jgi:hypothetical protein
VDKTAKQTLFQTQISKGVLLKTFTKFVKVGSLGINVGGHNSISCGVLKALATNMINGKTIPTDKTNKNKSMQRSEKVLFSME